MEMLELITGLPGSGKTTFAVSQRVAVEVGRKIKLDDEACIRAGVDLGSEVTRRVVVAGIKGLLFEHERLPHILTRDATKEAEVEEWNRMLQEPDRNGKMVDSDTPAHQRLPGDQPKEVPAIMQNWWLWCRLGDLIVIDEAQFVMERRAMGKLAPYWLRAMAIHRHYGVDFLIITQHPELIETAVRKLVGMHRHVRPVLGTPFCMVYVWDHASNPERYNMANKEKFLRRQKHYRLFKSAAAHVKPPASGRGMAIIAPVLLLAGLGGVGWKIYGLGGKTTEAVSPAKLKEGAGGVAGTNDVRSGSIRASVVARLEPPAPGFVQGCYAYEDKCSCVGEGGRPILVPHTVCMVSSRSYAGVVRWAPRKYPEAAETPASAARPKLPKLIGSTS